MDLVLLLQTTRRSFLAQRATSCGRSSGTSRLSTMVRASLVLLLLMQLVACAAPTETPVAVAASGPTQLPTVTPVPTDMPTATVTPTATALPTATVVPEPRYDLVLVGGTLIDATGAPPLENAAIAIQGRHIVEITTADLLRYSADTPVYDMRGATIMPGFINAHVHISGLSDDDLRHWTRAGVTTLRDLAGPLDELVATRNRMRESEDPAFPRLLIAGPIVTVDGGYPFAVREQSLRVEGLAVRDTDDARAIVTMLADSGADAIKLAVSGRTDVHWMELSDEEIAAITATAHARGLRVSSHVDRVVALRRAVLNGIDNAAHSPRDRLPDDVIALMVEHGVSLTPTIAVYEALARQRGNEVVWRKQMLPVMYDNLRRFVAAGGILALGDDYGGVPGMPIGMPIAELMHWQAAGLSPQQIIEASTYGSAEALGLETELGTVEVGKLADLLIVQGDPLSNLSALTQPLLVVRHGQVIAP
ncbi:MAG: amidohydrolase family protein [Oscillochloris sp.]|nr:amidohydrolase family protein [Oscillochloris sp.]